MTDGCGHPLCELIGGPCSLASHRSRGCRAGVGSRSVAPEVYDEVRAMLAVLASGAGDEDMRKAAVRLAELVRREARDDRNLLAQAWEDEPELAPSLARLCRRRG